MVVSKRERAEQKRLKEKQEHEKKLAEYHKKEVPLKAVKDKYKEVLFNIQGVHAVGLSVWDEEIIVHYEQPCGEIPKQLDGYTIKTIEEPRFNLTVAERPIPGGYSGSHQHVLGGTLGSWWRSSKFNRIVGLSNAHVVAVTELAFPRKKVQNDGTTPFSVLDGGDPLFTPVLADKGLSEEYKHVRTRDAYISSISPSSARIGDVVTITGQLGCRWGYSKVFVNGEEAPVKSWTMTGTEVDGTLYNGDPLTHWIDTETTIEFYVPSGVSLGTATIEVDVEGDPIISPARSDGGLYPQHVAGELGFYLPLTEYQNATTPGKGDMGYIFPTDDSLVYPGVKMRPASNTNYLNSEGNVFYKEGEEYFPRGIYTDPIYQGMAVIKTGRTTGTTISLVSETNITVNVMYSVGTRYVENCFAVYSLLNTEGTLLYLDGGDSGSSSFTCPKDLFERFYAYYGKSIPSNVIYHNEPFLFLGNVFASGNARGYSDTYTAWATEIGDTLAPVTLIVRGEATVYSETDGQLGVASTIYSNASSHSTTSAKLNRINPQEDVHLVPYSVPTDFNVIDFTLTVYEYATLPINLKAEVKSTASLRVVATARIQAGASSTSNANVTVQRPLLMTAQASSSSHSSMKIVVEIRAKASSVSNASIEIEIPFSLAEIKANAHSQSTAQLAIKATAYVKGQAQSISSTEAQLRLLVPIELTVHANGQSSTKLFLIIPGLNQQIEEITLTIQRELSLDMQIQRKHEINLAI